MRRDIAVVTAPETETGRLVDAVYEAHGADPRLSSMTDFRLFDLYRPKDAAQKSLAFTLELTAKGEEPVSDLEADAAVRAILDVLEREGATLRA